MYVCDVAISTVPSTNKVSEGKFQLYILLCIAHGSYNN